jgi:peptidoglycan/LPS O-acetylase OafA/YrhL
LRLQDLTVQSPNRSYAPELDQLRGAAALLVFFYHSVNSGYSATGTVGWPTTSNPLYAIILEGHTGVSLFIVLSAFVLARGTFGFTISYRDFVRNRALRIFPLAIIAIVLGIAGNKQIDFGKAASWFFLLGNTSGAGHDPAELAGTLWTATVEFQFYLIAPFLFAFTAQRGIVKFILPLIGFFFFMRLTLIVAAPKDPAEAYRISYYTIAGRIDQFLIGIALAYAVDFNLILLSRRMQIATFSAASIAIVGLLFAINRGGGLTHWTGYHVPLPEIEAALWAIFLYGYISLKPLDRIGTCLVWFGQISFGMYVLHYSIQRNWWLYLHPRLGLHLDPTVTAWIMSFVLLIPVTLIAWASYSCIERPFLAMRRRYLVGKIDLAAPAKPIGPSALPPAKTVALATEPVLVE